MSNGNSETISEKALNSTKIGGISALVLAGLSAIVPVVQTLAEKDIHVGVIIGMEALAAVLACVAAWIYTVDARIRADLTKKRLGARDETHTAAPQTGSAVGELAMLEDLVRLNVLNKEEFKRAKEKVLNGHAT